MKRPRKGSVRKRLKRLEAELLHKQTRIELPIGVSRGKLVFAKEKSASSVAAEESAIRKPSTDIIPDFIEEVK